MYANYGYRQYPKKRAVGARGRPAGVPLGTYRRAAAAIYARQRAYGAPKRLNAVRRGGAIVKRPRAAMAAGARGPKLSSCAMGYMKAQYNPFGSFLEPPCIPDFLPLPSTKRRYMCRGSMTVGLNGAGWVMVNPYSISSDDSELYGGQSNVFALAPIWSTYAVPDIVDADIINAADLTDPAAADPAGTGKKAWYWNSEFNDLAIRNGCASDDLAWRVVGCGLRLRYNGAPLYRRGTVILYEDPNNSGELVQHKRGFGGTNLTVSELGTKDTTTYEALRDIDYNVLYHPRSDLDIEYSTSWVTPLQAGGGAPETDTFVKSISQYPVLLIGVTGCDPANAGFEWEAVVHYEFTGSQMTGKTRTPSDPTGFGAVVSETPTTPEIKSPEAKEKDHARKVFDHLNMQSTPGYEHFVTHTQSADYSGDLKKLATGVASVWAPIVKAGIDAYGYL